MKNVFFNLFFCLGFSFCLSGAEKKLKIVGGVPIPTPGLKTFKPFNTPFQPCVGGVPLPQVKNPVTGKLAQVTSVTHLASIRKKQAQRKRTTLTPKDQEKLNQQFSKATAHYFSSIAPGDWNICTKKEQAQKLQRVEDLIKQGANIDMRHNVQSVPIVGSPYKRVFYQGCDKTALHEAVEKDEAKLTSILLKYGANPNVQNDEMQSPIFFAKSISTAKLLIQYGALFRAKDWHGGNVVFRLADARYFQYEDYVAVKLGRFFLAKGININATDKDGYTPLTWAIRQNINCGRNQFIEWLIANKANVNTVNKKGDTTFSFATQNALQDLINGNQNGYKIIQMLLDAGAYPTETELRNVLSENNITALKLYQQCYDYCTTWLSQDLTQHDPVKPLQKIIIDYVYPTFETARAALNNKPQTSIVAPPPALPAPRTASGPATPSTVLPLDAEDSDTHMSTGSNGSAPSASISASVSPSTTSSSSSASVSSISSTNSLPQ